MKTTALVITILLASHLLTGCGKKDEKPATPSASTPTASAPVTSTPEASTPPAATTETAATGAAEPISDQEVGVQFMQPAGWKHVIEGKAITLSTPDGELIVKFIISQVADYSKAMESVGGDLDKILTNVKIDSKGDPVEVNGLKGAGLNGTGDYEGKPVAWDLTILAAKKPLVVVSIGTRENLDKHMADYKNLVGSIKPL